MIFPLFKKWGATGLLVEWEDTFPYHDDLSILAASHAYSASDVTHILTLAARNNLEVIPLIQTFGHFEFVLKHPKYANIREISRYPDALCPSSPESLGLVKTMLQQILELHVDAKYIHIGTDEVWHLGQCDKCQARMKQKVWTTSELFLNHVSSVIQCVKNLCPDIQPIIWDDMLRTVDTHLLQEYLGDGIVDPMLWNYQTEETSRFSPALWEKISSVFSCVWAASAFKGATSSCQYLPVPRHHIANQEMWLRIIARESPRLTFRGIALTGWSRFDHYGSMCELLPVSLPSLTLCLETVINGEFSTTVHEKASQNLNFIQPITLDPFPRPKPVEEGLSYPGHSLYVAMQTYGNLRDRCSNLVNSQHLETWMNGWQVNKNFTNPMHLETFLPLMIDLQTGLTIFRDFVKTAMEDIYMDVTVHEWLGTYVEPLTTEIERLVTTTREQLALWDKH